MPRRRLGVIGRLRNLRHFHFLALHGQLVPPHQASPVYVHAGAGCDSERPATSQFPNQCHRLNRLRERSFARATSKPQCSQSSNATAPGLTCCLARAHIPLLRTAATRFEDSTFYHSVSSSTDPSPLARFNGISRLQVSLSRRPDNGCRQTEAFPQLQQSAAVDNRSHAPAKPHHGRLLPPTRSRLPS